jgi:flagellar basal-body rod modification protein FlgD
MSTSVSSTTTNPNNSLSQANFLQLLTTQMADQDPLDPQSDTEFASQLAQFSALQQSQNMSQDLSVLQANSMIGATVNVSSSTNSKSSVTGTVSEVVMNSGVPEVEVNGQLYNLSQINSITPTTSSTSTDSTSTPSTSTVPTASIGSAPTTN